MYFDKLIYGEVSNTPEVTGKEWSMSLDDRNKSVSDEFDDEYETSSEEFEESEENRYAELLRLHEANVSQKRPCGQPRLVESATASGEESAAYTALLMYFLMIEQGGGDTMLGKYIELPNFPEEMKRELRCLFTKFEIKGRGGDKKATIGESTTDRPHRF